MESQRVAKTNQTEQQRRAYHSPKPVAPIQTPVHPILRLQQTIGNQAVQRLIQAKLIVGQPNDKYEQEADQVADKVMRMPEPQYPEYEDEKELIRTKPLSDKITSLIQRQVEEEKEEEEELVQKVRPEYVSCEEYPRDWPIFKAIGTIKPVEVINTAVIRAIELLDNVINELEGTRNNILGGEPIAWPTVSDAVAIGLRNRFQINPSSSDVWTSMGAGTVDVLIKRYNAVRSILDGGELSYTCLAPATLNTPTCSGDCCISDWRACSCEGVYRIFLCRPWWSDSIDDQAGTLIHESFHIYFGGFIKDSGHLGNAHCYEQFIYDLNNLTVPVGFVGLCP